MANAQVGGVVGVARVSADAEARVGGIVGVARVSADAEARVGGVVMVVRAQLPRRALLLILQNHSAHTGGSLK